MSHTIRRPEADPVILSYMTREPRRPVTRDPRTGEMVAQSTHLAWTEFVRTFFAANAGKLDPFDAYATREALEALAPGDSMDIPDAFWTLWKNMLSPCVVFTADVVQSPECLALFRLITDAPKSEDENVRKLRPKSA